MQTCHAHVGLTAWLVVTLVASLGVTAESIDLRDAVVVVRPGYLPNAETAAAVVFVEEFAARTGIRLPTTANWPHGKTVIAITSTRDVPSWAVDIPTRKGVGHAETRPDGYRLAVGEGNVVWVIGADPRGALYGVGALLRHLDWDDGQASVQAQLNVATVPMYPIRGHQLGFRTQANSWDAWTPGQFDQYIRELALFGINSVENTPFHDERTTPAAKRNSV